MIQPSEKLRRVFSEVIEYDVQIFNNFNIIKVHSSGKFNELKARIFQELLGWNNKVYDFNCGEISVDYKIPHQTYFISEWKNYYTI